MGGEDEGIEGKCEKAMEEVVTKFEVRSLDVRGGRRRRGAVVLQ